VGPVLEDGLARLVRVGQRGSIHVNNDLIPLSGAGIDPVVQGALGKEGEGVGLLLLQGWELPLH
jgi:hypothetical protein